MIWYDRFDLWSDKPVINGKASSGNPGIYSAIFHALTDFIEEIPLPSVFFDTSFVKKNGTHKEWIRHPDKPYPVSLDEIIGWLLMGYITRQDLEYNWRYYDRGNQANVLRQVQALLYCTGKDRNFFKEHNVTDLHPIAYRVPFYVRYIATGNAKYYPFFLMWFFATMLQPNYFLGEKRTTAISQKNIAYAVLKKLQSRFLIKLIRVKKNINDYFIEGHPFRDLVKRVR